MHYPCQITQPHQYKSSQAEGEEDSCWASNTFLERIKAIQSSSLFPDYPEKQPWLPAAAVSSGCPGRLLSGWYLVPRRWQ